MQQLVGADVESESEAHCHFGGQPQHVTFVLRDQRLNNPDPVGEFDLDMAAPPPDAGGTLAEVTEGAGP